MKTYNYPATFNVLNKSKNTFLLSIIFLFLSIANSYGQKTAQEFFKKANEKAGTGDIPNAVNLYSKAIELNPNMTIAYVDRGTLKYSVKDYNGAIDDFSEVIKQKPDYSEAYFLRGNSYFFLKEIDSACKDFKSADKFGYPKAKERIGTVCIDSVINSPNKYFFEANKKFNQQNYQKALEDYSKAIELKPDFAKAYVMRGLVKDEMEDYKGAIADFTKAIEIDAKNVEAYLYRGLSLNNLNNKTAGCLDLKKASDMGFKKADELMKTNCK
jgi:tetratricopeptide (TPR) repeat protein